MCKPHNSVRPFKECFFHNHRLVAATNFSNISYQFFSSWGSGPNETPSILHGPSIQLEELRRAQLFHEPMRKFIYFSWLVLSPIMTSYLLISLLPSTISALLVTSTLTSSGYAVYQATTEARVGSGLPSTHPGTVPAQGCGAWERADDLDESTETKG